MPNDKDKKNNKILVLDCEVSGAIRNQGHPFDPRNRLVSCGCYDGNSYLGGILDRDDTPYGDLLSSIGDCVRDSNILIGVHIKFDLHWLRRYGIDFSSKEIWDCAIAHFLLQAQRHEYPSLNEILEYYNLPQKLDIVEKEYWNKGIDTNQIPQEILLEYMHHDIISTFEVYQRQVKEIEENGLSKLMWLCCADLLVLEEMEWNGMKYDKDKSLEKAKELHVEEVDILSQLVKLTGCDFINWESPSQISAVLYGGDIPVIHREIAGHYKTGKKTGQPRFRIIEETYRFPRLVEPLPNTQLKKDGQFKTDEPTLAQLSADGLPKQIIDLVLRLSRINKLLGTYYEGIPKKIGEFQWEDDFIHHSLNQCVAITGRLSSTKPNLQNTDPLVKECFVTRYE